MPNRVELYTNRVEDLLALLLLQNMGGASNETKAIYLSIAGFTTVEIANLMQMYAPEVNKLLHKPVRRTKRKGQK